MAFLATSEASSLTTVGRLYNNTTAINISTVHATNSILGISWVYCFDCR